MPKPKANNTNQDSTLPRLQQERQECAEGIAAKQAEIEEANAAADLGNAEAEARLLTLEAQQRRARAKLEGLDAEIQPLQAQERSEAVKARLLELDAVAEEKWRAAKQGRAEANDAICAVALRQADLERAFAVAQQEFLDVAAQLVPIHSFEVKDRPAQEVLRRELRERGAKLQAIGVTRHGHHVFTNGGGGDAPWPGLLGGLAYQAVQEAWRLPRDRPEAETQRGREVARV
jgi:hypothetical protein